MKIRDFDAPTLLDQSSSSRDVKALAREIMRLDELYTTLATRLAAIEALQVVNDRIVEDDTIVPRDKLPRSVHFDATYSLPRSNGLYALEYVAGGRSFRWSGPDPSFSFEFFINRTEGARALLHFERLYSGFVEQIQCLADGKLVFTNIIQVQNGFEISVDLPPRDDAGGTILTFVCPYTASPSELEGNDDIRYLGLAFQDLTVNSLGAGTISSSSSVDASS